MKFRFALAATAATLCFGASAQTKWDLPAAYPATNFHSENLVQFANDVDKASGGKLKITVHPNAALFKAPEIKRAVQGGQAQIGEVLLVNLDKAATKMAMSVVQGAFKRSRAGRPTAGESQFLASRFWQTAMTKQ
jgi:TRAP-type C4-dicarboxylate transport system substrate-binding protein